MKKKKDITLDELALMVGKGFNQMTDDLHEIKKDIKLVKQEVEDVTLKLDNVAYRFELNDLKRSFDRRIKALELKAGMK